MYATRGRARPRVHIVAPVFRSRIFTPIRLSWVIVWLRACSRDGHTYIRARTMRCIRIRRGTRAMLAWHHSRSRFVVYVSYSIAIRGFVLGLDLHVSVVTSFAAHTLAPWCLCVCGVRNFRIVWHRSAYTDPRRAHARTRVIWLQRIYTVHIVAFHTSHCVPQSFARPPRATCVWC